MTEPTEPTRSRSRIRGIQERGPRTTSRQRAAEPAHGTTAAVELAFRYYAPLERVRQFVEGNLTGNLSLTEAAKVAGLSAKYFSAFFKQHTGMRFCDWVARARVERAIALLEEKNRPITRVALAVGFKNVRTFQRAFKKVTGLTPRAFKKRVAP